MYIKLDWKRTVLFLIEKKYTNSTLFCHVFR